MTRAPATRASGRFLLRVDPALHEELQRAARRAGISLNEYCQRKLAAPDADVLGPGPPLLRRASELHDGDLVGLVAFGSWVRGEATRTSDLDLLVVLDAGRPLTRELYRGWDREPLEWRGHPVEPHIVHLPGPGPVGTVWAEVALDGVVLFERRLEVSRQLSMVRRDIAEGRLVRRTVHGQPYWAEVA